jgi:hypothetical protein
MQMLTLPQAAEWYRTELFEIPPRRYVSWPQYNLGEQALLSERMLSGATHIPEFSQLVLRPSGFGNPTGDVPHSLVTVLSIPEDVHHPYDMDQGLPTTDQRKDDVFCDEFLAGLIVLVQSKLTPDEENQIHDVAQDLGSSWARVVDRSIIKSLKPGPYLLVGDVLWEVRLMKILLELSS